MRRRGRGSGIGRLISAVAALALVFAQLIGAYTHAAGHDHAGAHAACTHLDGHHAAAQSHDTAALPAGDQGAVDKAQHDDDRAHHVMSCDFCCHGGIAVLAATGFSYVDPMPPYMSAVATIADPSSPPSLERPPRSSARA